LKAEEQRLLQELAALQEAEYATKKAIAEQEAEHERLDGEEERYWREYTRHQRDRMLAEDETERSEIYIYTLHFWNFSHEN
jgi:beclin 1